jgi:argininosuccinate synthase
LGTSVGGKETLTSNQPLPSDAYLLNYKRKEKKKLRYNLKRRISWSGRTDKPAKNIVILEKLAAHTP